MLLRVGCRKTIFENIGAEDVVTIEFTKKNGDPDLRPSVYEIDSGQIVQTHAEHQAGCKLSPTPLAHMDLQHHTLELDDTDGNEAFQFTKLVHRELVFQNRDQLVEFVKAIVSEGASRRLDTNKDELATLVYGQKLAEDEEWVAFFEQCDERLKKEWLKLIRRLEEQNSNPSETS